MAAVPPEYSPELASTLHRALDLPAADRLILYELLRQNVATAGPPATREDKAAQRRAEALRCLHVAKHDLGLAQRDHLEGPRYQAVADRLGDMMSSQAIGRAWDGWDNANLQHQRAESTTTLDDYRLRKAAGVRRTHEDYRTALRDWLATDPTPPTRSAYEIWAEVANRNPTAGQKPYPSPDTVQSRFNASWDVLVAWAPTDLPAPDQDRGLDDDPGPLGLVSRHGAARVIIGGDVPTTEANQTADLIKRGRTSLIPVAKLGQVVAYLRSDAEAVRDGEPVPAREPWDLAEVALSSSSVGRRIGVRGRHINNVVAREEWQLVPQPAGRVSQRWYWLSDDVDVWIHAHRALVDRRLSR